MNAQEKVATLEALLARVKKNAAQPRAPRQVQADVAQAGVDLADVALAGARPRAGVDLAPLVAEVPPVLPSVIPSDEETTLLMGAKPEAVAAAAAPAPVEVAPPAPPEPEPVLAEAAKPAPIEATPIAAEPPKATPIAAEPPKAEPVAAEAPKVAPPKVEAPVFDLRDSWTSPLPDPSKAPAIPATPATPKQPAAGRPAFSSRPAAEEAAKVAFTATGTALPKPAAEKPAGTTPAPVSVKPAAKAPVSEKAAAKAPISPTATGSGLPKVGFTATGSALPKVTPSAAPAAKSPTPPPVAAKPAPEALEDETVDAPTEMMKAKVAELASYEPAQDGETKIVPPATKAGLLAEMGAPPAMEPGPKVEVAPKLEALTEAPKVETPKPVVAKVEPKPEPVVARVEPKPEPVVARVEPKPEPVVARVEPKPEPVVAKVEPKPEPVVAKVEPKPEPVVVFEHVDVLAPKVEPKVEVAKVVLVEAPAPSPAVATAPVPVEPPPAPILVEPPPARDLEEPTASSRRYAPPMGDGVGPSGSRAASRITLALVAVVLVAAGGYLGLQNGWFGGSPKPVPTTKPSASPVPTTTSVDVPRVVPSVRPTAAVSAPPSATPSASASAAASAIPSATPSASASAAASAVPSATPSATPSAQPAVDGDGSNLPATKGYLVVESSSPQGVFATGRFIGLTGKKIEVDCGPKFLRLASAPPDGTPADNANIAWTSEGKSAIVACKAVTKVNIEPTK